MEDDGGDVVDGDGVYADFGPEQDYALLGMDGPPPSLQGEGCFRADSVDIMMPEVGGQSAECLQQPGPKDVQQTVALVVTVASIQQMSGSSRGSDGKNLAEQRDESMECADNQPDDTGSAVEENDEQEERGQELDGGNVEAQAWPGEQQPSACEEEDPMSETGSEGDRSRKNNSLRQRHFKVDVQEGMEHLYKTHICPECKRCFKKRTHLVEHLHLHFPDPSLQCPHCQKFFTSKGKLKVHLMREQGEKTHHCPLCDYSAVEKNSLNRHMASMHENTANFYSEVYACPACEEKFTVSNALKEHMKSHKEERRPLGCTEGGCGYTTPERKDFVRHLREAHGARAVECRYRTCGSLFGSEAGMETHRRTHYAFHCDQCDFVCSNKHVFRRHKRRGHPGSEELPCAFCPYKTFNPVEFNDHVGKMHANEKIHKCSECDFATAHKRVLNRHILLHTGIWVTCPSTCSHTPTTRTTCVQSVATSPSGSITSPCTCVNIPET